MKKWVKKTLLLVAGAAAIGIVLPLIGLACSSSNTGGTGNGGTGTGGNTNSTISSDSLFEVLSDGLSTYSESYLEGFSEDTTDTEVDKYLNENFNTSNYTLNSEYSSGVDSVTYIEWSAHIDTENEKIIFSVEVTLKEGYAWEDEFTGRKVFTLEYYFANEIVDGTTLYKALTKVADNDSLELTLADSYDDSNDQISTYVINHLFYDNNYSGKSVSIDLNGKDLNITTLYEDSKNYTLNVIENDFTFTNGNLSFTDLESSKTSADVEVYHNSTITFDSINLNFTGSGIAVGDWDATYGGGENAKLVVNDSELYGTGYFLITTNSYGDSSSETNYAAGGEVEITNSTLNLDGSDTSVVNGDAAVINADVDSTWTISDTTINATYARQGILARAGEFNLTNVDINFDLGYDASSNSNTDRSNPTKEEGGSEVSNWDSGTEASSGAIIIGNSGEITNYTSYADVVFNYNGGTINFTSTLTTFGDESFYAVLGVAKLNGKTTEINITVDAINFDSSISEDVKGHYTALKNYGDVANITSFKVNDVDVN